MLFTADAISALEAQQMGLVNKVVKHEELDDQVLQMARKICSFSLDTLSLGKRAFYQQVEMKDLGKAYDYASQVMVDNLKLGDTKEGIGAFVEKRKPQWKH